jgi:hypothetical protein
MTSDVAGIAMGEAALRYAWHGWPVAPGVPQDPRTDSWPPPAEVAMRYRSPMSTNDVVRCWQVHPYPVLLATGLTIDTLEVHRPRDVELLRSLEAHGPVAVLPGGRWLFFVEAGESPTGPPVRNIRAHGAGSWVPLPPTRIGDDSVRWHIDPASVNWRLARRGWVESALRLESRAHSRSKRPPASLGGPRSTRQHVHQRARPRDPGPRHRAPLVAGDHATVQVTYLNQEVH